MEEPKDVEEGFSRKEKNTLWGPNFPTSICVGVSAGVQSGRGGAKDDKIARGRHD